jgi:phenylalanyl-tRNA synthetase beta chain
MRYSVSWLKEYLDSPASVKELSERCTATGLEVEGVFSGAKLAELLTAEHVAPEVMAALASDTIVEVNVTANRPDLAGIYGIARDLAAAGIGTLKPLKIPEVKVSGNLQTPISVSCGLQQQFLSHASQFVGRYIKGVDNTKASPLEMRARLAAVGARSINPLVDITNYLCFGFCRPLHVFDADKVVGNIVVRHSKAGERFVGLDGAEHTLPAALTVIADEAGVLAVAGVLGGERSGCTPATRNVFLEVAYFDPVQTAKAGRALGINSAARYRFERGVDPMFLDAADRIATEMIVRLCGGECSAVTGYGAGFDRASFSFSPADVAKIIGLTVEERRQAEILSKLGISLSAQAGSNQLSAKPPSWRVDLTESRDLVEEVARIVGFDAVPMAQLFPPRALSSKSTLSTLQGRQFAAQNALARRGFNGAVTWSFMQDSHAACFAQASDGLKLVNPIASDLNYLRPTPIGNLMLACARNHARSVSSVALSEVGPGFSFANGAVSQQLFAVGVRSGMASERNWLSPAREVDPFDAKGDLFAVLSELGVSVEECKIDPTGAPAYYHPGLSAAVCLAGKSIGYFGVVHPQVREALSLGEYRGVAFEILLEALPEPKRETREFSRNDSQVVSRDFAFLLALDVSAERIEETAREGVRKSGVSLDTFAVSIFDRFTGKGIEPGKKSIAFSVEMQPPSGSTLESASIERVCSAVFEEVSSRLGGVRR